MSGQQSAPDDWASMIDDCAERSDLLTDWERSFIDSIWHQHSNTGSLSRKQADRLDEIWERVTA